MFHNRAFKKLKSFWRKGKRELLIEALLLPLEAIEWEGGPGYVISKVARLIYMPDGRFQAHFWETRSGFVPLPVKPEVPSPA